jgi:hypothetical protein
MPDRVSVHPVYHPSGRYRVVVYRRSDGCYAYAVEERCLFPDADESVWTADFDHSHSGVYDTPETALREAERDILWLKEPQMGDVEVEVLPPLADCFRHCEVECVRECCGIDAISTDAELIGGWSRQAGTETVGQALGQLRRVIEAVEDRSHKVSSIFLNHYTNDEAARLELLDFLGAFRTALQSDPLPKA